MHDLKSKVRSASGLPAHALEDELGVFPGERAGTAIRVRKPHTRGMLVFEQLARSPKSGWYVQKTFTLPCSILPGLITELRKAQCIHGSSRLSIQKAVPMMLRLAH